MEILHRVYQDYVAMGDGRITFDVPSGTESIERVIVAARELKPGIDYSVAFRPRDHFGPLTVTLAVEPKKGTTIAIQGIVWKRKSRRR